MKTKSTLLEKKKEEFRELQFATNPTETKGVLWRWTRHGLKIIDIFIEQATKEAKEEERERIKRLFREYHEQYPDANFYDFIGIVVGLGDIHEALKPKPNK